MPLIRDLPSESNTYTGSNIFLGGQTQLNTTQINGQAQFGNSIDDEPIPQFQTRFSTGTGGNDFLKIADASSVGSGHVMTLGLAGLMPGDIRLSLPTDATGALMSNTNTAAMTNKTLGAPGGIRCSTSTGTGVKFQNVNSITQFAMLDLSTLTAQRNWKGQDDAATMPLVVAPTSATTDKTAQTASIGATTVYTTTHTGMYRMSGYAVFTAVTTPGNLTLTAKYTDPQQAQTINFNRNNVVAYTAAGSEEDGEITFYATSGSVIQFSTTLTGVGTYNVYIRVEGLS